MTKHIYLPVLFLICLSFVLPQISEGQGYTGGNYGGSYGGEESKPMIIYAVVKKVTFDGQTSLLVLKKTDLKPLQETYAMEGKALSKAVQLVKKEWKKSNPETSFPRLAIGMSKVYQLKTFTDEKKAKEALKKYQEDWEKLEARKAKALEKRLKSMTPEKREKYDKNLALQKEALDKLRSKLADVIIDMKAKEREKNSKKTTK